MDREEEKLVATLQGMDAPGVTLTVSKRQKQNVDRKRQPRTTLRDVNTANIAEESPAADHRVDTMPATAGVRSVSVTPRASVETTTETDVMKVNIGSQICDDRYASSYKLAHCQMTPSSPPAAVSEFPPQRKEPCRNHGNFEIGGNGSAQWSFKIEQGSGPGFMPASRSGQVRASTSRIRHNGGSQILRDKGSSHRYCNTKRDTDAFEQSLRKYPSMGPLRTASHDLIDKLIRYTQAKNFQEMSRSSKSVRSLRNQKSEDPDDLQSKHQRTRRQDNNLPCNNGVQFEHIGRTRNFKLYSPMSDSRNLRQRETVFSTSYDYLKVGSPPDGRSNRFDGSPSPTKSPEDSSHPVRHGSPVGSKSPGSPGKTLRSERPMRFERSARDLSLSEMSKYIRSTIRKICNEKPVVSVFQVCPKLKNRYNQHKKVCPKKSELTDELVEIEEEPEASGCVLSGIIRSFSGWSMPLTDAGCQCNRTHFYCTRATQCTYESAVPINTVGCSCRSRTIEAKTSCSRDLTCVCARKAQEQAYYYKRIDEAISEWLKDVPVHSIKCAASKKKSETAIKKLRQTLEQLPDDENFDENVRNEISSFIDGFPLWNPCKDEEDHIMFKNQLAGKLINKIVAIPRKLDRFREIVTKWVENLNFEDDNKEIEMEVIDNFVNKLKSLAARRPACDMKYTYILRKEITQLLVELPLNYDSVMFKRKSHELATEIVNLPRNIKLSGDTDSTSVFEENITEWICDHGLCRELRKDPKLIEGLANKLKSQGIGDEELIETMKELIFEFLDDVDTAIGILDEIVDELMKTVPSTAQKDNLYSNQSVIGHGLSELKVKRFYQDELYEVVTDWISNLPGASDFPPSKFEKITEDIVTIVQDKQGKEDLENNIFEYLVDTGLPIDLDVLHTHVDELIERLGALPPSADFIEQAIRQMLKDIFKIIDDSSMSEEKQEELRNNALIPVQRKLTMMSSLNFLKDQDDVKEALLADVSRIFDKLMGESQGDLKNNLINSLSTTFDKSFIRLDKDESDLKQMIEKNVRKAVDELPLATSRKEELMGQVNETLCKHMNKPLRPNVRNMINDNISNIIETCPISENRCLCRRLKKTLFDVVGELLDMLLPKPVCDFQCKIEKDVGMVIDRCPIDSGNERQLKKCVQDIFTKNGDRPLSEEVVRTMQDEIYCVCSDLPIANDKKDILKKAVGASVSKNLNEALSSLSHDLIKLRKRLYDTITNVIEKSPITRDVKTNLKSQLKSVLVRNLDSSLSDEEKLNILDEISIILKDDMPKEKRKNLTNKLSNIIDTFQRKEKTKDLAEMITKDVDQLVNRLSIDSVAKEDVKKHIKAVLLNILYNPLTINKQHKIKADIINKIDEIDIPKNEKNYLKSNVAHAMTKVLNKLIAQGKEVPEIKTILAETIGNEIKNSSISKDKQESLYHKLHDVLVDNLVRDVTNEEKESTREKLTDIVDDLKLDKGKSEALKTQLLNDADKYFEKSAQDRMQTKELTAPIDESMSNYQRDYNIQKKILQGLESSIDDTSIPEEKKIEFKRKLKNITAKNLKKPLSGDATELTKPELKELEKEIQANIIRELENVIDGAPIPKEKEMELKKKLKDLTAQYFKNQLTDDVSVALENDMNEIIDEMNLPKDMKDKLKSELTATVDDNMSDLRSKTKSSQKEVDDLKALENETKVNIVRGLENAIAESPLPKEKKNELKKRLKDLTTQQFKSRLSDGVAVGLKDDMDEIIDELNLPKDKKDKLRKELTDTVDDNMSDLRGKTQSSGKEIDDLKALENETKVNIVRGLENAIAESPLPKEKKNELKKRLKDLTTQQFKSRLSDGVAVGLKDDMDEIIDEMNISKDKKDELKSELTATVDENMNNLKRKIKDDDSHTKKRSSLLPVEENKKKDRILQGIEKVIEKSAIPENKKRKLSGVLRKIASDDLKRRLSSDVQDKGSTQVDDFNELKRKTQSNLFLSHEKAIDKPKIPKSIRNHLKNKIMGHTNKHFMKKITDNTGQELKDDIKTEIDDQNLPEDLKDQLKIEINEAIDDNVGNLLKQLGLKIKPATTKVEGLKDIFQKFGINPSNQNQLVEEFNKLKETKLKGGDLEDARKKLIKKLQRDLNLPEEVASALADDMLDRARKTALKEYLGDIFDKYGIDPSYEDQLADDLNKLQETKLKGGDLEDARKKLIKKLQRDLNLPEEVASALADDMLDRARKTALKEYLGDIFDKYGIDPSYEDQLADDVNKLQERTLKGGDLEDARKKLIKKLQRDLNLPEEVASALADDMLDRARKTALKEYLGDIFDKYGIDPSYEDQLADDLNKLQETKLKGGDLEDARKKLIKKLQRDLNLPEEVASALADDMLDRARKTALKEYLGDIFDKYGIDPSYEDQLADDVNKLQERTLKGGDLEDARKKLIKKLQRDLNLPEEVASALADDMLDRARKTALKEYLGDIFDKYGIDPSYEDQLADDLNKLQETKLKGGDLEDARKKLIKKLQRDLNLPEEVASALADDMLDRARKTALKEYLGDIFDKYGIDPSHEDQLADDVNKLQETKLKGGDLEDARKKLIKKLQRDLNLPEEVASALADDMLDRARKTALKEYLGDIFDKYGIDPSYEDQLADDLNKLQETKLKGGDLEDARKKLIKKLQRDLNLPEEVASALADDMLDRARKTALKEYLGDIFDKYGIDPSYEDQLADDLNKLQETKLKGGDLEDARKKLIKKLQRDLNLPEEVASALADDMLDRARKTALKEYLGDIFDKYGIDPSYEDQLADDLNKLQETKLKGGDLEDARKKLIKKLQRDLNLPEEVASALADDMLDRARKTAPKEYLGDIFDKYGIDPSYEDQLADDLNKLQETKLKGGDLEDARKKLIKKLQRDLNLPEEVASALADDMLDRARKTALKEYLGDIFDKYGIDPSYEDQLVDDVNKLQERTLKGGDLEDARKKLIKKLQRDLNLPEEVASALADDMLDRARKTALKEYLGDIFDKYGIDPSYEDQLADDVNKLQERTLKGGDLEDARKKLIKKLQRDLNLPEEVASALADDMLDRARKTALKEYLGDIFDKYGIDPSYEDQLADDLNKLQETKLKGGDLEDGRKKLIKKLQRDLNLPEEVASALADDMLDRARKTALKEYLGDIFDKYGIDPSYEDQLVDDVNKLQERTLKGGDLEDARKKLIKKLQRDLNLPEEVASALADDMLDRARKTALKEYLGDIFDKYGIDPSYEDQLVDDVNKLQERTLKGGDLEDARKKLIKKLQRDLNLPEEVASALADDMLDRARKTALKEYLGDIFDKYGIDPSYEDQLADDVNKLQETKLKGGDLEDARKKLIKKLQRDLNLPEEVASALADDMLDRARKTALKEYLGDIFDKYGIDPSYEDQLVDDVNKLQERTLKGGDLEDARKKLIKKLQRDLNLPEEVASALADDMLDRARKTALKEYLGDIFDKYGIDPSYEDQLADDVNKLQETKLKGGDLEDARKKLIKKLQRDLNLPEEVASALADDMLDRARKTALKEYLGDIFDKYGIDPSYEDQLADDLNKLQETKLKGGDLEDGRKKLIKKLQRDLNLPEEVASALADDMLDRARKTALKEYLGDIFDKYGIDPSYEDQLADDVNKLQETKLKGGDLEDARKKLIKKLQRDLNLPEQVASALADDMLDRARKTALKEYLGDIFDKYGIDPSYEDQLADDVNKLQETKLKGGDLEDARKKLIKKLQRDLNLPEEVASALADDMLDRARKTALKEYLGDIFDKYGIDPSYEDQLADDLNKLQETKLKGGDLEDGRKKLIKKLQRDLNLPEEVASALADDMLDRARKTALKEYLGDIFDKYGIDPSYEDQLVDDVNKLQERTLKGGDLEDARKKLIKKLQRDLNLPEEVASALADDMLDRARKTALKEYLGDIFDKYGIDPSYEDQLADDVNKLQETKLKGGDLEDARKKLIKKLQRDLNLPEEVASALADDMLDRVRKTALKEYLGDIFDKYGIDPSYEDQLVDDVNKLQERTLKGGDLEDARKKLIKKLQRDLNLPEEVASALADDMLDRARKTALKEYLGDIFDKYGIDPSYEDQLADDVNKLQETKLKGGDLEDARKKLIKKLQRDLNLPEEVASALADDMLDRARKTALKEYLGDIFDKYGIDPSYEDQLADDLNKLQETKLKGGDLEDGRKKLIKKLQRDLNLPEEVASALADDMLDRARKTALKEYLGDIFDKYGIDPSYEDQLVDDVNKLQETKLKGGDLEDARKKLIKKLQRDLNLPEEVASALADDMLDRARKTALKEYLGDIFDKYGIDPSYEDQLVDDVNKLQERTLKGGDLEDARKKLIKKLQRDLNLPEEVASALADDMLDRARKTALKEYLGDIFDKYGIDPSYEDQLADDVNKLQETKLKGGDLEDARKKLIKKLQRDLNLPEEVASALADDMLDRARKTALKEYLGDIFDKYGIDPSYEDQLVDDVNKLQERTLKGGDLEDARKKLIKKLQRDLNLPEEVASALADDMLDRARKTALKEYLGDIFDKYGIDPSYEDQLADDLNKLQETKLKGGDLEDGRKKLIKKLQRDLNLPEEVASALADDMLDRARKTALKEYLGDIFDKYGIDPSYEDQLADDVNKLQETKLKGGDLEDARKKLIKKLQRDLNLPEEVASALADDMLDRARKTALKEYLGDIFDKYGIDPSYEDQLADDVNKLQELTLKSGDLEDARKKLIKKLMRDLNLPEEETSALADDLIARAQQMALAGKTTEAFTQAISDAVDQSTVAKADKPILKNKLLSKLTQTLDKKPYIHKDDIGLLKEEVLKECNEIVDESSIPMDKKNELKQLFKEKLEKAFPEDGAGENLADYKDKIKKYIKKWMDSLPIHLNPKVAATAEDNIASDILGRQKYLHAYPEAKSSEKDEIENLKYQVFRRMYRVVNPKAIPKIMERTEDLYNMIMNIKKELESQQGVVNNVN